MIRLQRTADRPFPWRCGNCGETQVYRTAAPYTSTVNYDGQLCAIEIPCLSVPKCANCGEVVFDNNAGRQIDEALRQQLGLLQAEQIRAGRTQLGLEPDEFASQLGVTEERLAHWETGSQLQPRVVDREIRLYFELPAVRNALNRLELGERIGESVRATEH